MCGHVRGEMAFYSLIENHHRGGILRLSIAPAPNFTAELQEMAESATRKVLEALEYVGVLCIEFFQVRWEAAGERDGAASAQFGALEH